MKCKVDILTMMLIYFEIRAVCSKQQVLETMATASVLGLNLSYPKHLL